MKKIEHTFMGEYDFLYEQTLETEKFYVYRFTSSMGIVGSILFERRIDDNGDEIWPQTDDFGKSAWTIVDPEFLLKLIKTKFNEDYIYDEDNNLIKKQDGMDKQTNQQFI